MPYVCLISSHVSRSVFVSAPLFSSPLVCFILSCGLVCLAVCLMSVHELTQTLRFVCLRVPKFLGPRIKTLRSDGDVECGSVCLLSTSILTVV